jgi:5-methylthioadenosine/S-adenosylhomocysteine deaminase
MELLIEGGTVVTLDAKRRIIKDGAVVIKDNKIIDVDKAQVLKRKHPSIETLDAKGKLICPGLVDAHIHMAQMLARGLTDEIDNVTIRWSWDRVYPWEANLTQDDVYISAKLCAAELIKTGTTCAADPGAPHMDSVGKVLQETGLRGIIAEASMDQWSDEWPLPPGVRAFSTEEALKDSEALIKKWNKAANDRIRGWCSLRVMPNLSSNLIKGINELAHKYNVGIEIHAAVTKGRVDYIKKQTGFTKIKYLDSLGVLGPNWLMTHMIWITEDEIPLLKEHNVNVCHCPGASYHGGAGALSIGKFPEMINSGINVALGCDSSAANNSLDMFRTMYQVATGHKEARRDGDLISPEQALEMATINGAKGLMWNDQIGSIEVGKKADIIIVDYQKSNWVPTYDFSLIPNLVYSADGADVETVIIDGKIVMEDRVIKTFKEEEVVERAQKTAERLVSKLPYRLNPRWPIY